MLQCRLKFAVLWLVVFASLVTGKVSAQEKITAGAAAELYVPFPIENAIADGERTRIRSVEFTTQASFDTLSPALRGKLTIGADDVSGALVFNVREGFVLASDLIPQLDLRAGKFFLPIGILNQTRRSAWAFSTAPFAFGRFFDPAGVADTGFEFVYHVSPKFRMTAGLTNGYRYDSSIQNGGTRPMTPTHFLRPEFVFELGSSNLKTGLNYLSRVSDVGDSLRVSGIDLRWAPLNASSTSWAAQAEYYDRAVAPNSLPLSEDIGGYAYVEKGVSEAFIAGARIDHYQIRSLTDANGNYRNNSIVTLTPILTYRGRDHLRLQGSYAYLKDTRSGNADRIEQLIELRLSTEFGDCPKARDLSADPSSL